MKRNKLLFLVGGLLLASVAIAAQYSGTLLSNATQGADTTATIDLNTVVRGGITTLSAQAVYSSATVAASTFNDGRVSTASIAVVTVAGLTSNTSTNSITLAATATLLAAGATNFLTVLSTGSVNPVVISYGPNKVRQGTEWQVATTATGTAANITTALNKYSGLTATRSSNVISLSLAGGAAGNGKTLSVNASSVTAGGAAFGGGYNSRVANAVITINGTALRQGYEWQAADTSSGTATNLAAILNKKAGIKAQAIGSVIYSTATTAGVHGNAYTLVSNAQSYMTVANPTYVGGNSNAYVIINGVKLEQGTAWTAGATSALTAKALSDAIMANSSLNTIIRSTWNAAGVVTATSTIAGASQNYPLVTNAASNFTLSGVSMQGGLTPAYALGGTAITVASHGLGTGMAVTYTASTPPAPLVNSTVYYAAKLDANTIALATSKANAVAGTYITLTSSTTTGPNTSTLTPVAISGTAGLSWQASNDNANWSNLAVSSVSFASPYTAAQSTWTFGTVGFRYVRASFVSPTNGAVNIVVTVNGN